MVAQHIGSLEGYSGVPGRNRGPLTGFEGIGSLALMGPVPPNQAARELPADASDPLGVEDLLCGVLQPILTGEVTKDRRAREVDIRVPLKSDRFD